MIGKVGDRHDLLITRKVSSQPSVRIAKATPRGPFDSFVSQAAIRSGKVRSERISVNSPRALGRSIARSPPEFHLECHSARMNHP